MTWHLFLLFLFSLNSFATDEVNNKKMENERKELYSMIDYGKSLMEEFGQIQKACNVLKKFTEKRECPEYSKQIQEKLDSIENSLVEQKHSFFSFLKGAVVYGRHCGTCDKKAQEKYCPLMDEVLAKYDYLKK